MLRALVVMLGLVFAVGAARADTDVDPAHATDAARAKVSKSEKRRARLVAAQNDLQSAYQDQLAQIDSLKRQKASWRRDRQLKDALASSLETAKQLAKAGAGISSADLALLSQRKALLAAIDAELAAGAVADDRAATLANLRARVSRLVSPPKKIVIPDDEIDPLADPDELDQQAAALEASERELTRQIATLDDDATRFQKQADLKKAHDRAGEMAIRDDDQPRRTSGSGGHTDSLSGAPEPTSDNPSPQDNTGGGMFDGDPAIVLSDVVDADTVDALRKAEQSSDPAAKAAAANQARDAVKKRLAALAARRKEIEERAKALRQ